MDALFSLPFVLETRFRHWLPSSGASKVFPHGPRVLYTPDAFNHLVDIVFIHDLTENLAETWTKQGSKSKPWPTKLLPCQEPGARIILYGYDASIVKSLDSILDPDWLKKQATDFLQEFPLRRDCQAGNNKASGRPIVVFAHGFGGLIYEQALVLSLEQTDDERDPEKRRPEGHHQYDRVLRPHRAVLFGTPHFGAGLAEWAVMSATRLGILQGKTAQSQEWAPYKQQLGNISKMQKRFRDLIWECGTRVQIAGCVSIYPEPTNKLMLSQEWATLPGFTPIMVSLNHFDMTKELPTEELLLLLWQWIRELTQPGRGPEFKRPAYADPLKQLRMISRTTGRQWCQVRTLAHARSGLIALGSIIGAYRGPLRVVASEGNIRSSLLRMEPISPTSYTEIGYEALHEGVAAHGPGASNTVKSDLLLWNDFISSVGARPETSGASSLSTCEGPGFESLVTKEWEPDEDYLDSLPRFLNNSSWLQSHLPHRWLDFGPLYVVVGIKMVVDPTIPTQINTRFDGDLEVNPSARPAGGPDLMEGLESSDRAPLHLTTDLSGQSRCLGKDKDLVVAFAVRQVDWCPLSVRVVNGFSRDA